MNFENIQTVVVIRKSDDIKINISQINDDNRYDEYECIVCGSKMIPAVPGGKTVNGSIAKVTPYFKHLNADKCGSESFQHFWAKTELIKVGDKFKVITDKENEYICNQIFFEKTIIINDKRYTPDATIITSCGNTIHFEFNYSNHKKIKDYIDKWKELKHIIVEVDINSMLCVFTDTTPSFKALYYEGKCFNLTDEDDLYVKTIGKYIITKSDEEYLKSKEIEIEKLDCLWEETRKIIFQNKGFEDIGNLIRAISQGEGRKIAIDILSKKQCGDSILNKYVSFLKSNVDKRLKLLNLKYNGYLIKYETEIPRYIYDRIFNGIIIKFYIPDNDNPEIYQTYNYDFKDEILSIVLKNRIDFVVTHLSSANNSLLHIINVLKLNNKVIDSKLHYKERTDYVDSIYFEDYRNSRFILYDHKNISKNKFADVFDGFINDIEFIDLRDCRGYIYGNALNVFITETEDSYGFSYNIPVKYKFNNIFKQDNINLTYKSWDKSFKFLPRYDFVKTTQFLEEILDTIRKNICSLERDFYQTEYANKIYQDGTIIEISDLEINKKIEQLLYPIVFESNRCDSDSLNIIFNKDFTKEDNRLKLWVIKDFIYILNKFVNIHINNIQKEEEYIES